MTAGMSVHRRMIRLPGLRRESRNNVAGIDVSLEYSSVCVVDGAGKIMREQKIASEPEALIAWFR